MTIDSDKKRLRQQLRRQRKTLNRSYRTWATRHINRLLYPLIRRHKRLGVYWATGSELSLMPLIMTAQQRGAEVYLPYIETNQRQLWFTPCPRLNNPRITQRYLRQHNLHVRKRQIPQFEGAKIRAHWLKTLIIPLVGIDHQGHRLGQGGGYYDATLSVQHKVKPQMIAVGFSCQQVRQIQTDPHDINMPIFVCEQGYQYFNQNRSD